MKQGRTATVESRATEQTIKYGLSVYGEEEIQAVVAALRSSTQMGVHVRRFEESVARIVGKQHGVMVNSGSSANYLALATAKFAPGDEVITPALTFATTVAPIVQHGLTPVFVDVGRGTYVVDVEQIEPMISPRTKALMIPALIGNAPDWDILREIAGRHDLLLIEDSADTLGARFRGSPPGTRTHVTTTSFYGSHVITCAGNGGMVCFDDELRASAAKLLRSWGRSSSLFVDSESIEHRFDVTVDGIPYDAKFVFSEIGFNFEPSEIGAAFGMVQLERLEGNTAKRLENFSAHRAFFARYADWLILPEQLPAVQTAWLAFPLTLRDSAPFARRDLQIHLERAGIQTRTVFTGNILRQPGFRNVVRREYPAGFTVADEVMRGGVLIGCHHGMSQAQVGTIHEVFEEFAGRF